jgi:hypothetical protein
VIFLAAAAVVIPLREIEAAEVPVSNVTQECLDCHVSSTPAMVADWKRSRHARITTADALKKPEPQRLVSADKMHKLAGVAVGCAECHAQSCNSQRHFDNDHKVHLTVTPKLHACIRPRFAI